MRIKSYCILTYAKHFYSLVYIHFLINFSNSFTKSRIISPTHNVIPRALYRPKYYFRSQLFLFRQQSFSRGIRDVFITVLCKTTGVCRINHVNHPQYFSLFFVCSNVADNCNRNCAVTRAGCRRQTRGRDGFGEGVGVGWVSAR